MPEKLTAKKYLDNFLNNPEDVQMEFLRKMDSETMLAIESFSNTLRQDYDKLNTKFNCFSVLVALGYLLKDNLIRAGLEDCLKGDCNFKDIPKDEIVTTKIVGVPKDLIDSAGTKKRFITYDDFLKRFEKGQHCFDLMFEFGVDFACEPDIKCKSLTCYNKFREAYFGE